MVWDVGCCEFGISCLVDLNSIFFSRGCTPVLHEIRIVVMAELILSQEAVTSMR